MNKYIELENIIKDKSRIRYNEPMKNHITAKVGGPCDVMVFPKSIDEIKQVISYAKKNNIPYFVMGKGSNLLVADKGINMIVIKISNDFDDIKIDGEYMEVLAGTSMPKIAVIAKNNFLSGFEFACGIPGTIGGGIFMNAGAYGGEIKDVIVNVTFLDENDNIVTFDNDKLEFSYRKSYFANHPDCVILSCKLKLKKVADTKEIEEKMLKNNTARKEKQPLEYPNFGSVFKRPEGYFVGKLISDCNLKGYRIGGAEISKKHAGFIVNIGNATCNDILSLIKYIQDTVNNNFGVMLTPEVKLIGGEFK